MHFPIFQKRAARLQYLSKRHGVAALCVLAASCAPPQSPLAHKQSPLIPGPALTPYRLNDPYERVNRGVWAVNRGVFQGVIAPTSRGYRAVVPEKARQSVRNFGYNVIYPGRLLNEALQGRWSDAGHDSARFVSNTTVGVLGLFDVASRMKIPKPQADFAQTFNSWGWQPSTYVMLPLVGPSDNMHAVGYGMDRLADPMTYNETTRLASYGISYNKVSETAEDTERLIVSDPDSYSTLHYLWTYASQNQPPDWTLHGTPDPATMETLGVTLFKLKDPGFPQIGHESRVLIPSTGKRLPFNYWMQKNPAPVVYIASGLGSHRLSMQALVLAESLYQHGFSVVSTSGLFHPEFMESASTSDVCGYSPADSQDLLAALTEIDHFLVKKYSDRVGARALVGCSMGGYLALTLANGQKSQSQDSVHFDRYVAINPPVNLHHGLDALDRYQLAPMQWPESVRQERIDNTILKVSALAMQPSSVGKVPPFDGVETKYLIGLSFRMTLRNAIYSSQMRHNMGILKAPLSRWDRKEVYDEILRISFKEYFEHFAVPYYRDRGISAQEFKRAGDLKGCGRNLAGATNTYVVTSSNDFLLAPEDVSWLKSTFGSSRLSMFDHGGHLGGLGNPAFQGKVMNALEGLKTR